MSSARITYIASLGIDRIAPATPSTETGDIFEDISSSTSSGSDGALQVLASARSSAIKTKPTQGNLHIQILGAFDQGDIGMEITEALQTHGISLEDMRRPRGRGGMITATNANGDSIALDHPAEYYYWQPIDFVSFPATPFPDLVVLQLELPWPVVLQILSRAGPDGLQVLFSPWPAAMEFDELIWGQIKYVVLLEREMTTLSRRGIAKAQLTESQASTLRKMDLLELATDYLRQLGAEIIIVWLGSLEVFYQERDEPCRLVQTLPVKVSEDAAGAGDVFVGVFASEIARWNRFVRRERPEVRFEVDKAVMKAIKAATMFSERTGTLDAIPWEDEIEKETMRAMVIPERPTTDSILRNFTPKDLIRLKDGDDIFE
ncbi:hypothetical protein MMC24_007836 [Lignoscripta atroalba]|nr:hypothetical protein [Lignoscripta atroalba]